MDLSHKGTWPHSASAVLPKIGTLKSFMFLFLSPRQVGFLVSATVRYGAVIKPLSYNSTNEAATDSHE